MRHARGKARVELHRRNEDAETVGADDPQSRCAGRAFDGFGQRARTVTEARGDDDRGGATPGAGGGDHRRHLRRRRSNDDDIRCVRKIGNAFDARDALNLSGSED